MLFQNIKFSHWFLVGYIMSEYSDAGTSSSIRHKDLQGQK